MRDKKRCGWAPDNNKEYLLYHDIEWGVPVHDDVMLFEMLILEGAQAGLSWATILKRRDGYRSAFKGFDPIMVSKMTDDELEQLILDSGIIRNRLKIYGARKNAIAFLAIQKEFGSFDKYLWDFVGGIQIQNHRKSLNEVPSSTEISDKISKDLKKRGMTFVGSTIIYAYMQAIGMVNDHTIDCFRHSEIG